MPLCKPSLRWVRGPCGEALPEQQRCSLLRHEKRELLIHSNPPAPSYTIHGKARFKLGNAVLTFLSCFFIYSIAQQSPFPKLSSGPHFSRLKTKDLFCPKAQDPKPKILERCSERVPGAAWWDGPSLGLVPPRKRAWEAQAEPDRAGGGSPC